jgi:hypothetical protein
MVSLSFNEILPHVYGHGGKEISKGETQPVQSITHLLGHFEPHVWTLL